MKVLTDDRTRVIVAGSPEEMARHAVAGCVRKGERIRTGHAGFGRDFTRWEDLNTLMRTPWPEGVEKVRQFTKVLEEQDLAPPQDVRRKGRWSDVDGEVDVDRALRGEPEYYRQVSRSSVLSPTTKVVLLNTGGHRKETPDDMFWRGAAAAAAVDLLEEAGYGCEVWAWGFTYKAFLSNGRNPVHAFQAVRVKEAGDVLDLPTLAAATSGWFYRTAFFGSRIAEGKPRGNMGYHTNHEPTPWLKHLDLPGPAVLMAQSARDRQSAAQAAAELIRKVTTNEETSDGEV